MKFKEIHALFFKNILLCVMILLNTFAYSQNEQLTLQEKKSLAVIDQHILLGDTLTPKLIDSIIKTITPSNSQAYSLHLLRKKATAYEKNNQFHMVATTLEQGWLKAKSYDIASYMPMFFPALPKAMWRSGNYAKAIKYYVFLENNYTLLNDMDILYSIYNDNGLIYHRLNYPEKAQEYYLKAIKFSKQQNNEKMLGVSLTNLGALYYDTNRYKKSLNLFLQGVKIEERTNQKEKAGRSYAYIAKNYLALGDSTNAEKYLQKALQYNQTTSDMFGLVRTYIAQAQFFNKAKNQPQLAINRLNKVVTMAKKAGLKEEEKQAWRALAKLYQQQELFDSAYWALQHEYKMDMQLSNIEEVLTSQNLAYQLELEKRANQIHQMNLSRQEARTRSYGIGFLILMVLLSIISFLYYKIIRSKKTLVVKNQESEAQRNELQKLNQKLVKAYAEIEKSNTLKTQFLNNISHEIRTPLNGILGFSAMIATDNLTNVERQEYFKMIEINSSALLETIDDIVNMAMITSKEVKVNSSQIDVNAFIDEVFELFKVERTFINKHQLQIHPVKLQENQILASDIGKLRIIMTKLLDNALKFTKEGEVTFGCMPHNHAVEWFVKDTGIGIPEEHHDRIFEKFYQVKNNNTRIFEGSGLGLTIAHHYITILGGHMWFHSEPGKGSSFHFTIPKK
ncbi:MAG: tetratricopeptide repeat-containing sensor histidine kinase [Bacteroidota bacterium]